MSSYTDYYNQLTGAFITRFMGMAKHPDYGREYPMFRAKLLSGKWVTLSISSDPEENEGGFIVIEEDDNE